MPGWCGLPEALSLLPAAALLKQRHDELPKLVETCKQYMKHERAYAPATATLRNLRATLRRIVGIDRFGRSESR